MTDDADIASESPGWEAINRALEPLYPGAEPQHWGTLLKWRMGGPDPLDGISIYEREDHWHYVSYGMSELYQKESDIAEVSGWGFEFTFRVARRPGGEHEHGPVWAANLLQNLGRYVFSTGNNFAAGHHMTLNGPINLEDENTLIRHVAFCADPELGRIDTPHGELTFLQVVGLTDAEYEAAQAWNTEKLLDTLRERLPLLVTDPTRQSLLDDPALAQTVAEGISRDGSSSASTWTTQLGWERSADHTRIVVGALAAPNIATSAARQASLPPPVRRLRRATRAPIPARRLPRHHRTRPGHVARHRSRSPDRAALRRADHPRGDRPHRPGPEHRSRTNRNQNRVRRSDRHRRQVGWHTGAGRR